MFANISAVLQSLAYSTILDVDPAEFQGDSEGLNEERVRKIGFVAIPFFFIVSLAFVSTIFVKEDLKRLNYKL